MKNDTTLINWALMNVVTLANGENDGEEGTLYENQSGESFYIFI